MSLRDILAPINDLLSQQGIHYAVIGGYAVAAWGEVRATRDIDLLCSKLDLDDLKRAFGLANLEIEHRTGEPDDPISEVVQLQAGTASNPYEVDIIAGIRGAPEGIIRRARTIPIDDLNIPVASPEDMIILKLLGGSARDIEDARSIIRAQANKLDLSLIRRLCPASVTRPLETLLNPEATR